jgi:transcriptional regulator with XRE-family HTH domain
MLSPSQNVVGEQVRKLRYARELTQETLAAKCNVLGWDLSRGTLAKIESGVRCVTDAELFVLAKALKQEIGDLYPQDERVIFTLLGE